MKKTIDDTRIALIGNDISYMKNDIGEIKSSIKLLDGVYATKAFIDDSNRAFDIRIQRLEASSQLWKWLSPTLSALASSGATFLFINYLQHLK